MKWLSDKFLQRQKFYETPPGSSCYTGKLLQLRFLKNWNTAGVLGYVV